jgi:hypothetical protein
MKFGGLQTERVDCPVDVSVVIFIVIPFSLYNLPRLLRGGGVVKVYERMPVYFTI